MRKIDELPTEVLGRIFVLGEGIQRDHRAAGLPYVGFQDLVVQICRWWRDVAIGTPELWTYIYISGPAPHLHAKLSLSRSGTLPLDIDMDMGLSFYGLAHQLDDWKQETLALETMSFIQGCGGTVDRWKSLIVLSNTPLILLTMVRLATARPTPVLQFLSLTWNNIGGSQLQEIMLYQASLPFGFPSLVHGPERPQFRHIEAIGLSNRFLFGSRSPLVSNLTTFKFACSVAEATPSFKDFSALLSASPQLESLSVDMRCAGSELDLPELGPPEIAMLRVSLPRLRSFSLDTSHWHQWCLDLLQIIDAPGVEYFSINTVFKFHFSLSTPDELYEYLAKGRINGVLQCYASIEADIPDTEPVFPLLKHLDVGRMACSPEKILPIFRIFPMVTHVTLGGRGILGLSDQPDLLPNASHFTYIDDGSPDLSLAIFSRLWGAPRGISTLIICTGGPRQLCKGLSLPYEDHIWSERHYHLPGVVNNLIVRQTGPKRMDREGGDGDIVAEFNAEHNGDEHIDRCTEFETSMRGSSEEDMYVYSG